MKEKAKTIRNKHGEEIPLVWEFFEGYGYAGTDATWYQHLLDDHIYTKEQLESMTLEQIRTELSRETWENAAERVDAGARPKGE